MAPQPRQRFLSFARRSAHLIGHFFSPESILAKRLPHIYGPHCLLSYLYKLYALSFLGFALAGQRDLLLVSAGGFIANAVSVGAVFGFFGGFTKLASIPHLIALGFPAWRTFLALPASPAEQPLAFVSCAAALAFYVPVLAGDFGELFQVFVQRKYLVLLPSGAVHPMRGWTDIDRSVTLDFSEMFVTARPPPP